MAFISDSESIETVSYQPERLTFDFMSVNIGGAVLDDFGFLPQLDPAWLPGHFIEVLDTQTPIN